MPSNLFQSLPASNACWRKNIVTLLKIATEARNLCLGKAIHVHMIKSAEWDIVQTNYMIHLYVKCGPLWIARRVFDSMPQRNTISVNLLMAGYFHGGHPWDVLKLFRSMDFSKRANGPNEYVFTTALAACADVLACKEGKQCHGYVLKSGLLQYPHVRNGLLHMYSKCSAMEDAVGVFETIHGFDIYASNCMIDGFLNDGKSTEAIQVLSGMVSKVGRWDHVSYATVLGLCVYSKDLKLGKQVHTQILKRRIEYSVFVSSAIVDMYGKCGEVQNARCAFEGQMDNNVVSWTSIIAAFIQNNFFEEGLKLFIDMEADGIQPNEITYSVVLNCCAGLSALRNGDALNARIQKYGCGAHLNVCNALINMYCKSGGIKDAIRVFTTMRSRDIFSWNSIIIGLSHHGLAREALETFHSLLAESEIPTYVTFVGVLLACGHLGLVDQAFYYFNHMMKDFGIRPGIEHHTCMVGVLCRDGQLDEADRFMRSTCIEWDVVAWRTLLSSCQVHKNYDLGHRVADHILRLHPDDVGTYILLSNMYAKANRWDGVVKMRMLMRQRSIKKEPGISWIELGGEVHVFTSEDKKRLGMTRISEKIAELIDQIKAIGYVPNIGIALHDVGDEQKEEYLRYHSEKLAIAFALIHSPEAAPIHVMKNLRVCDDCHVAVKLISVVTKRRIVLRDANRFHCFESGVCSCGDYW